MVDCKIYAMRWALFVAILISCLTAVVGDLKAWNIASNPSVEEVMPGQCVFNETWLENSCYADWLERDRLNRHKAKCNVCVKSFGLGSMGEAAVRSHMKGRKHVSLSDKRKRLRTPAVSQFLVGQQSSGTGPSSTATQQQTSANVSSSTSEQTGSGPSTSRTMASFVTREETVKSEVLWTLHVVQRHNSFKSNEGIDKLFQAMFPDSDPTCGPDDGRCFAC